MFYLDYVGCKDYGRITRMARRASFISTMWDVKGITEAETTEVANCFISTMWDVK